jgi:ketosteroid isomerase-like protein
MTTGLAPADDAAQILALEGAALDRWAKGDPDGFLEASHPDVVYFDPVLEKRLDGLEELRALYGQFRGKIQVDEYRIIDPQVRVSDNMAVLTFNFVSHTGAAEHRWNTTEVFQREGGRWRIVHTHWSFTQPRLAV